LGSPHALSPSHAGSLRTDNRVVADPVKTGEMLVGSDDLRP